MITRLRRLILILCLIFVLAFVFSDGLLYYCSKWHERTGEVKKAMSGYKKLLREHPGGRWADKARKAVDRLGAGGE